MLFIIRIGCWVVLLTSLLVLTGSAQPRSFRKALAHNAQIRYSITPIVAPDHTWGYVISMDGKPLIRQTSIPALPGNRGFSSRTRAQRAAGLVVDKLRRGEMPPALTKEELQKAKLI